MPKCYTIEIEGLGTVRARLAGEPSEETITALEAIAREAVRMNADGRLDEPAARDRPREKKPE